MDERIEKAFAVANYSATLSNQRRIILEEFTQNLIHYVNGATFKVSPELINFTKTVLDLGHTEDVAFVDAHSHPVIISDVRLFLDTITEIYFTALNAYSIKFAEIKTKRKVFDITSL